MLSVLYHYLRPVLFGVQKEKVSAGCFMKAFFTRCYIFSFFSREE